MYLTLPLPINKKWRHEIYYIPWDTNKTHVKIPVELSRDATFRDLRALLGRWMSTNPDNVKTLVPPFFPLLTFDVCTAPYTGDLLTSLLQKSRRFATLWGDGRE